MLLGDSHIAEETYWKIEYKIHGFMATQPSPSKKPMATARLLQGYKGLPQN